MTQRYLDPEEERWDRKYPRFPGVATCVELLGSTNVRGTWVEIICAELQKHADEHADELIAATRSELERESGLARILLHVVADSKLPAAQDLFVDLLASPDRTLHDYGLDGLKQLDTKESRRLIWEYRRQASQES